MLRFRRTTAMAIGAAALAGALVAAHERADDRNVAPVITPGKGFTRATDEPGVIGDGPGSDAQAIARFDVVPHQVFDADFGVGVVAFHINGIDRVEFCAQGGNWTAVRSMTQNPQTRVWEYWATLRAKDLTDGPVEVRAIAYPVLGRPRVLEPLVIAANARGSLPRTVRWVDGAKGSDGSGDGSKARPFKTIFMAARAIDVANGAPHFADNGTVYLEAGDYDFAGRPSYSVAPPTTNQAWLTISGSPGVAAAKVRITSASADSALSTRLVRLQNLTVHRAQLTAPSNLGAAIWFDGCVLSGSGRTDSVTFAGPTSFTGGIFATHTSIKDTRDGFNGALLERDVTLTNIGSDAFDNPRMIVDCRVDGIDATGTDAHPDVVQYNGCFDNTIVYGLRALGCKSEGIFARDGASGERASNQAFVNVLIELRSSLLGQWLVPCDHLLFWHVTFVGNAFLIADDAGPLLKRTTIRNLSIRNSVFEKLVLDDSIVDGSSARDRERAVSNNHFIDTASFKGVAPGAASSRGGSLSTLFTDPAKRDYRPSERSPLRARVTSILVPADVAGQPLAPPAAIGALQ